MHWLDHAIATLEKEALRWKHSDGGKADAHATAAAILSKVAASGATHDEVKTQLLAEPDETAQEGAPDADGDPRFPPGGVTADVHITEQTPPA